MSAERHETESPVDAQLSPEELAFRASLEELVDFYRVEQAGALWRAFLPPALVFLPLGSLFTALAMSTRFVSFSLQPLFVLFALAVTAAGPVWAIVSLLRSMQRDDRYIALFLKGLRVRLDAEREPVFIRWEELADVQCEERCIRISLSQRVDSLEITSRFAELTLKQLAERIRTAKRLALWGRLDRASFANTLT